MKCISFKVYQFGLLLCVKLYVSLKPVKKAKAFVRITYCTGNSHMSSNSISEFVVFLRSSRLPWFDVFIKLLNKISEITSNGSGDSQLQLLLEAVYNTKVPSPNEPCTILPGSPLVSSPLYDTQSQRNYVAIIS